VHLAATNAALKEWAVVCRALADGRQTLLIRKGGILEIRDGFQVVHGKFWLFPTYVHQSSEDLVHSMRAEFEAVHALPPEDGTLEIQLYARVVDETAVTSLERLRALEGLHVLSWDCVESRFRYRNRPGVHVLTLRLFRCPEPVRVPYRSWYDGCVSWVDLDEPIGTDGLVPVLPETEFEARRAEIRARLTGVPLSA
jgi:hypothetical protein